MSNPSFTYTANVPQAEQKISATQEPILNNFQAINDFFVQNHVGFIDPINYGKHTFTTFPFQSSDPSTDSSEMALYSKATSGQNPGELFYRYPNDGNVIQLTPISGSVIGWTTLPNGYFWIYGNATGINTGTNTILFSSASSNVPVFTTSVQYIDFSPTSSYSGTSPSPYISSSTLTGFVLTVPGPFSSTISWTAIGT